MKRLLSLVLVLGLLVSVASMSFAAVTVGGNARVWYQNVSNIDTAGNTDPDVNGFRFDRLALTASGTFSDTDGFKSEIQFRQPRNDAKVTVTNSSTTTTDSNGNPVYNSTAANKYNTDIRIDSAYYYKKALLLDKDEFDIGYIQKIPFCSGVGNEIIFDMLADNIVTNNTNSVGIKYADTIGDFDWAVAFVNANATYQYGNDNGFAYGIRLNYAGVPGLKVGAGYLRDGAVGSTNTVATSNNTDVYGTAYVVDANYNVGPFGAYVEYLSWTRHTADSTTDGTNSKGMYSELNYKLSSAVTAYAAREVSLSDDSLWSNGYPAMTFADGLAGENVQVNSNWTSAGIKVQAASNLAFQGEYLKEGNDAGTSIAAVRCMVTF